MERRESEAGGVAFGSPPAAPPPPPASEFRSFGSPITADPKATRFSTHTDSEGRLLIEFLEVDDDETKCKVENETNDRVVGCLLGVMIGDVLGAGVEGMRAKEVNIEFPNGVSRFIGRSHLGVKELGPRRGMYTDDTQSTMALADSLVTQGKLDPEHAAMNFAKFYRHEPKRGYPPTARKVFEALENGVPYTETGVLRYYLINIFILNVGYRFPEGSLANGGAMKISPIGIAFRKAPDDILHEAVRLAIVSSHVHPEAIDGAFIQAKAIAILLNADITTFEPRVFLSTLKDCARTEAMRSRILKIEENLENRELLEDPLAERKFIRGMSDEFQIAAVEAMAVVLWAFMHHHEEPQKALPKIISFGGDTDTLASILGAQLGALHGTSWIPWGWWEGLENEEFGRDYLVELASKLARFEWTSLNA
jgi:poly(ADP-ribose) glycohydrolase ARH3